MNKLLMRCGLALICLLAGSASFAASGTSTDVAPQNSLYYQVQGHEGETLDMQFFIWAEKPRGFSARSIIVKVNGEVLTPAFLVDREPKGTIRDGRSFTFITETGGLTAPYGPTPTAIDAGSYGLENGVSMSLYRFSVKGLMHAGLNTVEVYNCKEEGTVTVSGVIYNGRALPALRTLPPQSESAYAVLPVFSAPFSPLAVPPADDGKTFALGSGADTKILWRGVQIIAGEALSYYGETPFSGLNGQAEVRTNVGWRVVNTWDEQAAWPYRKEVAVSVDGREVELNVCMDVPAYTQKDDESMTYTMTLPLAAFNGMRYSGISGRTYSPKTHAGEILTDQTPDGNLLGTSLRYLALEGNGKQIVFDFNPEGVQTYSDFGPTHVQGLWAVKKSEAGLTFSFGRTLNVEGGVLNSKLRIFEGSLDDYLNRHAYRKYGYLSELEVDLRFCFGAPKAGEGFIQAGTDVYDGAKGFGWSREPELESIRQTGALFTAAKGSGEASFKCRVARPGLYILTLRNTAYETARGAFSVSANEKKITSDQQVPPYTVKDITWSQWLEEGELELVFSGENWAVSSLSAQMLQHSLEDFKFRRAFWVADGLFEPNPVYESMNFVTPVHHAVAVTEMTLPKEPVIDPTTTSTLPKGEICLPDQNDPAMAWRYTADLGTLGPSNNGSLDEFATPELIRRRLTEVKANGINAVIVNGLLGRHNYPSQLARVQKTMKQIVEIAHELDMKVIDHQDLTLLWNQGEAFRVMCEELDTTQRTVSGALPHRGTCLANDRFCKQYYDRLVPYILETGIDGIMIDETFFHGESFCGCADCRRKFTEDSGLILPMDETSPLLKNKKSILWRTWLEWREKKVGDFMVGIRKRLKGKKEDLTYLTYTTHGGFSGSTALQRGDCLVNAGRACDFIGTEIMSRNVMATYRATYAFRKAMNALRLAFGSPIFGLVYSQSDDVATFGWAMNNMNAQVTWKKVSEASDRTDFFGFDNMDRRLAESVSDVAVFYSIQSRDWVKYTGMINDTISVSEALTDHHIMHDFFIEESVTDEFLKKYKMVILPASCAISCEHIETFLRYAENGGTLMLSSTSGLLDQMGIDYEVWPFAKLLGLTKEPGVKWSMYTQVAFDGQPSVELGEDSAVFIKVDSGAEPAPTVISQVMNNHKPVQPLVVERSLGKGRVIYSAAKLASLNYEREISVGWEWKDKLNHAADDYFVQLMNRIVDLDSLGFVPVQIPRQVLVSVYRQTQDGTTSTMVHLLNATGVNNTVGEKVASEASAPAWPSMRQDVVFEIDLPSFKQAYAVSFDFEGRKPVIAEKISENRYRLTMPKNLLKKYSIIFMEH